ncbi:MAG: hypothetical protein U5L45_03580 [Saprospiraceae bacterium]|nr:hypothetical protein [Saprospiraceae bacterium]
MLNIFKQDQKNYEGVRPINIYVLRLFFALIAFMMGYTAWTHIFAHKGVWEPINAVTWCVWAAYATLSVIGIYNTLKMLPILLFMICYKTLWLFVVAYPLWKANKLIGSPSEELAMIFVWVIIPALFFPWIYFYKFRKNLAMNNCIEIVVLGTK